MNRPDSLRISFLNKKNGSILIYVLWLSALLGLFTLSIGYTVRQKLKLIERIDTRRSLRLAAESGAQRGLWAIHRPMAEEKKADALNSVWSHDDVTFNDVEFEQTRLSVEKSGAGQAPAEIRFGLVDEESKVNINLLKDAEILKQLALNGAQTTEEEAGIISDAVLDWIDVDDHVNASGAENQYYRGLKRALTPKNAPLDSLEELLYVRGFTPAIYQLLAPYLTLYGDGKINLNTAAKTVLLSIGLESAAVDFILNYRAGVDQKIGTRDDGIFYNPEELVTDAQGSGALSADSIDRLNQFLSRGILKVSSDYFEVQSKVSRKNGQDLLVSRAVISRQFGIQSWNEVNTQNA